MELMCKPRIPNTDCSIELVPKYAETYWFDHLKKAHSIMNAPGDDFRQRAPRSDLLHLMYTALNDEESLSWWCEDLALSLFAQENAELITSCITAWSVEAAHAEMDLVTTWKSACVDTPAILFSPIAEVHARRIEIQNEWVPLTSLCIIATVKALVKRNGYGAIVSEKAESTLLATHLRKHPRVSCSKLRPQSYPWTSTDRSIFNVQPQSYQRIQLARVVLCKLRLGYHTMRIQSGTVVLL
jgi:hypothetical protein